MHLFRLPYMHGNIWSRSMQMSKYIMFRWKMFVHLLMMSMRAASFRNEQGTVPCFVFGKIKKGEFYGTDFT